VSEKNCMPLAGRLVRIVADIDGGEQPVEGEMHAKLPQLFVRIPQGDDLEVSLGLSICVCTYKVFK